MIKSRFAGLVLGTALATALYAHDSSPLPTASPAVYQNAVASTYSGTAPNDSLKVPGPSPSPAKHVFSKGLSGVLRPLVSTAIVKPAPSPTPGQLTAAPSPVPLKAVVTPSPSLRKTMALVDTQSPKEVASPSPAQLERVGPPAPKPTKTEVSANLVKSIGMASAGTGSRSPGPGTERTTGNSSLAYVSMKPLPNASPTTQKNSGGATPPTAAPAPSPTPEPAVGLVVSVRDQKLAVVVNGKIYRTYRISTSRYGEGDYYGSWKTPLGHLQVATKIGAAAPAGAVFRRRQLTGEILAPNAPGRDPIISRIIWLRGTEQENKRAYQRCIYIHGTPQEEFLGRKASYGCIRMRSADVIEVFNWVGIGTNVAIVDQPIRRAVKDEAGGLTARNELRVAVPEGSPSEANR